MGSLLVCHHEIALDAEADDPNCRSKKDLFQPSSFLELHAIQRCREVRRTYSVEDSKAAVLDWRKSAENERRSAAIVVRCLEEILAVRRVAVRHSSLEVDPSEHRSKALDQETNSSVSSVGESG